MNDQPEDPPPPIVTRALTPEEQEIENQREWERMDATDAAKTLHALFCNRIFVQPDGLHLRVTLGERVENDTVYHASFVIPNADAIEFGRLITRMGEASLDHQLAFYREVIAQRDAELKDAGGGEG